jgi:Flp pilus assembly pilin Flp
MTNWFLLTQARLANAYSALRYREEGQGTAEYAVLVGAVVAMALAVIGVLTGKIEAFISSINFGP